MELTHKLEETVQHANDIAHAFGQTHITRDHLLAALLRDTQVEELLYRMLVTEPTDALKAWRANWEANWLPNGQRVATPVLGQRSNARR